MPFGLSKYFDYTGAKDLDRQIQEALKYSTDVNAKELAKLVQDYVPEYTSILETLRDEEVTLYQGRRPQARDACSENNATAPKDGAQGR